MPYYESIYILRPDLSTEQMEQVQGRLAQFIGQFGGVILRTEHWGRRDLAYPVGKSNRGYYLFHLLEGKGPFLGQLEDLLKIQEDILKFLHVRVKTAKMEPTPLGRRNEERTRPALAATEE